MQITDANTIDTYYHALVNRLEDYVGIFYVGVKTTAIFCIASCRARKPKPENVIFYSDMQSALAAGFRPCKICKPCENAHEAPTEVQHAMALLHNAPSDKISDATLRQHNLSPANIRRWFNRHYGMTFQAYQRMIRINQAYIEVKQGHKVTDAALNSGYQSLSGFQYGFQKYLKHPPSKEHHHRLVLHRFTSPLGPMFVCASERGTCLLEFVDRRMLETEFEDIQKRFCAVIIVGENAHTRTTEKQIGEYFAGTRKSFDVSLDTPGTEFQQHVWQALQAIPFGQTSSYSNQAKALGKASAVRAVARANGMNRVSIIIPCHRVIGANGNLLGYGGGLQRKQWLLEHEARLANA